MQKNVRCSRSIGKDDVRRQSSPHVRKFLKMVGVNSQREIEHAVAKAIASGAIAGTESFPAKVTLEVPEVKLKVEFKDLIRLE
ncbi:DUF6494 family protein [Paraburkholderia sp. SIMBA_030]|uniref:DUF6494 family protein n=1 Tax=Paraburkholderia sp. SIMBA_030 TaxID=3085773 RepID=UPI00397CE369